MAAPSTPLLARSKTAPKVSNRTSSSAIKAKPNTNGNILSFFQKAGPTVRTQKSEALIKAEESLFLDDDDFGTGPKLGKVVQTPTPPKEYNEYEDLPTAYSWEVEETETMRYNEDDIPVKRRKTEDASKRSTPSPGVNAGAKKKLFFSRMETSDDQDMEDTPAIGIEAEACNNSSIATPDAEVAPKDEVANETKTANPIPSLKQECTGYAEVNDFEGVGDFIDDEFPEEGEEYLERRWMQEQADLEMGLEEDDEGTSSDGKAIKEEVEVDTEIVMHNEEATSCPICFASLTGITDQVGFNAWQIFYSSKFVPASVITRERLPRWQTHTASNPSALCQSRAKAGGTEEKGCSTQALPESCNCEAWPRKPIRPHLYTWYLFNCLLHANVRPRRGCCVGQRSSCRDRLKGQTGISADMSFL